MSNDSTHFAGCRYLQDLKTYSNYLLQASLTSMDIVLSQITPRCLYSIPSSICTLSMFQILFACKNTLFNSLKTTMRHFIKPYSNLHLFTYLKQIASIISRARFEYKPTSISSFFLSNDTESFNFDNHLRCGGWLNFEFSKREKHSGWAIKTIYKKLNRGMLKHIPLNQ